MLLAAWGSKDAKPKDYLFETGWMIEEKKQPVDEGWKSVRTLTEDEVNEIIRKAQSENE